MFRNLAAIVNRSMGGKADMQEIWPLFIDPKPEPVEVWTQEDLDELVKRGNRTAGLRKKN